MSNHFSGCSVARLSRLVWDEEVAGSNPATPTKTSNSLLLVFLYLRTMFTVYILYSSECNSYYTGYTSMPVSYRLHQHHFNHKGYTAKTKDWNVVYTIKFKLKSNALKCERKIKKRGAKRFLNERTSR